MKKHKTHQHNFIVERMCDDFNDARDLRELTLVTHLYLEYFINELVVARLKTPELIIDDNELGSFKNKIFVLRALGVFDDIPHVLGNVELIQRTRNYYAHNLLVTDEIPEPASSRIKQLVYFEDSKICDYDTAWKDHADPLHAQLQACAVETANSLISLCEATKT